IDPEADRGVFVETAFRQILARPSDAAEQEACLDFWEAAAALEPVREATDPEAAIRSRLVHALLNHNDFVTVRCSPPAPAPRATPSSPVPSPAANSCTAPGLASADSPSAPCWGGTASARRRRWDGS